VSELQMISGYSYGKGVALAPTSFSHDLDGQGLCASSSGVQKQWQ
jgi:hypothetical protein